MQLHSLYTIVLEKIHFDQLYVGWKIFGIIVIRMLYLYLLPIKLILFMKELSVVMMGLNYLGTIRCCISRLRLKIRKMSKELLCIPLPIYSIRLMEASLKLMIKIRLLKLANKTHSLITMYKKIVNAEFTFICYYIFINQIIFNVMNKI